MNDEQTHIKRCLGEIEVMLNWGDSSRWSNYDFEKLAGLIADKTSVQLSVSTLKRVWGKVSYNNAPSVTTLNTLVQFLGYGDWRGYTSPQPSRNGGTSSPKREGEASAQTVIAIDEKPGAATQEVLKPARGKRRTLLYALTGVVVLVVLTGLFTFSGNKKKPDASRFSFSVNKVVSEGVPNSVIFTYDASAAQTDSVYIVQTWDIRRKKLVPRDKHEHSAIYYYPGYFKTRLIVDGEVMQSHNLMITSDGWLCLAEDEPVPLYFKKTEYIKTGKVEIDTNTLRNYQLSLYPKAPKIRFFNQRDLGDLQNDNYTFETKLKNEFAQGTGACQFAQVLIQCKNDIIIIPLAAKSCVGDLQLTAAGTFVTSKEADLSKFGCDLSQWTTLRVETVNKRMRFFVNGMEVYSLTFPNNPTGIVGLQYRFAGVGAVKDTWFKSKGQVYDFGPDSVRIYKDTVAK
jgi:hypothetical protein